MIIINKKARREEEALEGRLKIEEEEEEECPGLLDKWRWGSGRGHGRAQLEAKCSMGVGEIFLAVSAGEKVCWP